MEAKTKAWARQILKSCQLSLKAHSSHPPYHHPWPTTLPFLFLLEMLAGRWIEAPHFHMKWAASSDLLSPGKVNFSSSCEKAWWDCGYEYSCWRVPCQSVKESWGELCMSPVVYLAVEGICANSGLGHSITNFCCILVSALFVKESLFLLYQLHAFNCFHFPLTIHIYVIISIHLGKRKSCRSISMSPVMCDWNERIQPANKETL